MSDSSFGLLRYTIIVSSEYVGEDEENVREGKGVSNGNGKRLKNRLVGL